MRKAAWATFLAISALAAMCAAQQGMTNTERGRMEIMLDQVHSQVAKHYYDEKLHGLDWEARYKQYRSRMEKVQTMPDGLRVIAAFLAGLKDSHTFFEPPRLVKREDYGYRMEIVGDKCYIAEVRPGSDAATKLHPGDEVLGLNGYAVNRTDLWQFWYALNSLQPVTATSVRKQTPDGKVGQELVQATMITGKRIRDMTFDNGDTDFWQLILDEERQVHDLRQRCVETGDLMIWKMPAFLMGPGDMEEMIGMARKHKNLIIDLRSNPGGSTDTLEQLVGSMFDHAVPIAQRIGRKSMKPMVSKRSGPPFTGNLIVLVDSRSASAAELFARTMQLNHRGIVMGDRTSGSVMESRIYSLQQGSDTLIVYGASITDADLIMADGLSLENRGVTPDEVALPTPEDMAESRDPVLARAAEKLGVKLDPKAAGAFFPFEWTAIRDE